MNKQFDELTLSAYIDGELDPKTLKEVDVYLDKEPGARKYVLNVLRATARMRGTMNAVLHEDVPDHLIDTLRLQRAQKKRRSFMQHPFLRMAAAIVFVFMGFSAGTILNQSNQDPLSALSGPLPARYSNVVDQALEFNRSGISKEWQAPQEALAVTVTPVKTYRDQNGRYFREYRLDVSVAQDRRQIKGLAYRTAAGNWKTKAVFYH